MNDKKKLLYAVGLLLVVGILAALVVNTTSNQETQSDKKTAPDIVPTVMPTVIPSKPVEFVYSAKFVCGVSKGGFAEPVLKGNYSTAINVHNPQGTAVNFTKKAVIALREGKWGNVSNKIDFAIGPDKAFEIDCSDIAGILRQSNIPMPQFTKGFVVIEIYPPKELDIVGVYTAGGANVESIDVETVNPKSVNILPCPKTNISLNTGFNQVSGGLIGFNLGDDDWNVVVDPFNLVPRPATVVDTTITGQSQIWPAPFPSSRWISVNATRGIDQYRGTNVTYQYNFTLPPCFSNASMSLSIRADNRAWVFLNGNFVSLTANYPSLSTIGTSTGFTAGTNSLIVVVRDDAGITGFDLVGTVTAN